MCVLLFSVFFMCVLLFSVFFFSRPAELTAQMMRRKEAVDAKVAQKKAADDFKYQGLDFIERLDRSGKCAKCPLDSDSQSTVHCTECGALCDVRLTLIYLIQKKDICI